MALFPCEAVPHPYRGAQQTIYPAIVTGSVSERRKLRLCPEHFAELVAQLEARAWDAAQDAPTDSPAQCLSCGGRVESREASFFATVYAKGAERQDWWAPLHSDCVAACEESWGLLSS